jgi:hypothetical protein
MKMNGMENLANWIVQSPVFTMDITPTITAIADLETQARAAQPTISRTINAYPGFRSL